MRAIVQRVSSAQVSVKGKMVGKINAGYFVLLGITSSDTQKTAEKLAVKISKLRLMRDESDKMNLDLKTANASCLVVSQFTLYADTSKGNRPSFVKAADPKQAKLLYEFFIKTLESQNIKTETGKFGAYMDIDAKLDGPVTIFLEI